MADHILAANEELLNKGNASAATEYFASSYVVHLSDRDLRGPRFVEEFVDQLGAAFPDLTVDVEVFASEGDRVAWQRTNRGTHEGDFHGFPATGREIVWREMVVSRLENGKIAEEWAVSDLAERLLAARR